MRTLQGKLLAVAALAGVVGALAGPAFAGFDEAQTWSFNRHQEAAPAATTGVPDGARAEYQGDGFTILRQQSHQYLDCMGRGGGRMTCKPM